MNDRDAADAVPVEPPSPQDAAIEALRKLEGVLAGPHGKGGAYVKDLAAARAEAQSVLALFDPSARRARTGDTMTEQAPLVVYVQRLTPCDFCDEDGGYVNDKSGWDCYPYGDATYVPPPVEDCPYCEGAKLRYVYDDDLAAVALAAISAAPPERPAEPSRQDADTYARMVIGIDACERTCVHDVPYQLRCNECPGVQPDSDSVAALDGDQP